MTAHRHQKSTSEAATENAGAALAGELLPGDVVLLEGDLAAGKTTLTRGIVAALSGEPREVSSPTFVLVHSYPVDHGPIRTLHHVDLYRLADSRDQHVGLGLDELLTDPAAVVVVEWPRRALVAWLPAAARVWRITITVDEAERRSIEIECPEFR